MKKNKKLKLKKFPLFILIVLLVSIGIGITIFVLKPFDKNITKTDNKETTTKVANSKKIGASPEISLYGIEDMKIVKNGVYEEYGAKAIDEEDGDISSNITINNNIKVDVPGDYTVDYIVKDKDGNETTKIRKVKVFEVEEKDTDGIAVLMYHYFYDDTAGEKGKSSNYLAKSLFEEELKYLYENDYYIPTMKELNLYLDGKLDLPKKSVILTLDDGEVSNYTIAYPLAVQYKVPLVWFVVTSWTDVSMEYQKELYNTGYIRYHSHTDDMHSAGCPEQHGGKILCVDHAKGVADLKTSSEKLGNADALAYPCGDTNEHAQAIVKEAGITLAFTTQYGKVHVGDNKLALTRVRINDGLSLKNFISSI